MAKDKHYWNTNAKFPDGLVVEDKAVAEFAKSHMRFRDRLDIRKVTEAVLLSFSILSGSVDHPKKDGKWYFKWN